jgi:hypothetical protein
MSRRSDIPTSASWQVGAHLRQRARFLPEAHAATTTPEPLGPRAGRHHWSTPLVDTIGRHHWSTPLVDTIGRHHWSTPLVGPRVTRNEKHAAGRSADIPPSVLCDRVPAGCTRPRTPAAVELTRSKGSTQPVRARFGPLNSPSTARSAARAPDRRECRTPRPGSHRMRTSA